MGNDFIVMIHCLTYLAIHHDNRYSSKDLAFNACSNPAIVRKLMSQAVKKGWVSTTAGKQGGYQWEGDPKKVKLGEIFLLVSEDERLETQPALSVPEWEALWANCKKNKSNNKLISITNAPSKT